MNKSCLYCIHRNVCKFKPVDIAFSMPENMSEHFKILVKINTKIFDSWTKCIYSWAGNNCEYCEVKNDTE
ncbi:MAG: hypothetical protein ACFFDY_01445 [Candidatus Thorarchaeota archaeon]